MKNLLNLSDEDYLLIEDAVGANARGRAFLRMRDQRARVMAADEIKRLMRSLTLSLKKTAPPDSESSSHIRILRQELQEMSACIQQTRTEIAALRPDDNGNNRILAATGELDAIVTATERATSDILNSAENILALVGRLPREGEMGTIRQELETQATEILTTCSFQDITGQRTTKVVNTLHYLEKRVNSMIEVWGTDGQRTAPIEDRADSRPDAHLLNGPSLNGVSQDDVDALLANLNAPSPPAASPASEPEPPGTMAKPAGPAPEPAAAAKAKPTEPPSAPSKPAPNPMPSAALSNGVHHSGAAINQNEIDALFD